MKQADIAMYQAKKSGRNRVRFFDPKMQKIIQAQARMDDELHEALKRGQLQLHFQVQVNAHGKPVGAEALLRWNHPRRGIISPGKFIGLAEDTGLILPIGQWVLDEACAQVRKWQNNPLTHDLSVAVNVSSRQFRQVDFVKQVEDALKQNSINPRLLKLELTESMLLENIDDTIIKMNDLKAIGVRISLDDFGTGYSSLSYLKRLPLDQVKIDHSFVLNITTDKGDVVMVRTIVDLAMNFELDIIAEGVETDAQFKMLKRYGCAGLQGFLFGKPAPADQFEELLLQMSGAAPSISLQHA